VPITLDGKIRSPLDLEIRIRRRLAGGIKVREAS
jgi:hypothetical protein